MRVLRALIVLAIVALPCNVSARDKLCAPLRNFVASVQPGQTRSLEFHTNWGGGFKDSKRPDLVIYEKRCDSHDYAQATAVCELLMQNGAVEFSGENAKRALTCLSPATVFGGHVQLERGEFSFHYGSDDRGSNLTLKYDEDHEIGGAVLTITARGY